MENSICQSVHTGTLFKSADVISTALTALTTSDSPGLASAAATAAKLYDSVVFPCGEWLDEVRGGGQLTRRLTRTNG
jgi:hypothetical protein